MIKRSKESVKRSENVGEAGHAMALVDEEGHAEALVGEKGLGDKEEHAFGGKDGQAIDRLEFVGKKLPDFKIDENFFAKLAATGAENGKFIPLSLSSSKTISALDLLPEPISNERMESEVLLSAKFSGPGPVGISVELNPVSTGLDGRRIVTERLNSSGPERLTVTEPLILNDILKEKSVKIDQKQENTENQCSKSNPIFSKIFT